MQDVLCSILEMHTKRERVLCIDIGSLGTGMGLGNLLEWGTGNGTWQSTGMGDWEWNLLVYCLEQHLLYLRDPGPSPHQDHGVNLALREKDGG